MRILIVTDAWTPQVNGVVTSLAALVGELRGLGHQVKLLSPADFRAVPCPTYPEIPLVWDLWRVGTAIRDFRPDCVHLATEGPLGWAARRWLVKRGLAFSTAIHTRFPSPQPSRAGDYRAVARGVRRLGSATAATVAQRRGHPAVSAGRDAPPTCATGVSLRRTHRSGKEPAGFSRSGVTR
ncbi:glycosyltransferase [Pseudomonas sihuiensis]|uniref:glycosyltransferase n=1 Tax=Pseudomonas sihuiensis TaxID=1274359 RepID=UPI0038B6A234